MWRVQQGSDGPRPFCTRFLVLRSLRWAQAIARRRCLAVGNAIAVGVGPAGLVTELGLSIIHEAVAAAVGRVALVVAEKPQQRIHTRRGLRALL